MLYFDNAATTFPKPFAVKKAVEEAFCSFGANPGRSGYKMGMETSRKVYETREKAAVFPNRKTLFLPKTVPRL